MSEYIHGSTDARETARLERQAKFVAPWWLASFQVAPGARVLDLGTGIGAMARELSARFPGVELTALDRSEEQLAVARARHPVAAYVLGDATALPFADGAFDLVHASWLLEHVPDPVAVVREARRVLRPGGLACFVEVDNRTLRTEPPLPVVAEVMDALDHAQIAGGGDPWVGRNLGAIFRQAGFDAELDVRPLPLVGDESDLAFFRAFVEEFAEIFESIDEAVTKELHARIHEAATRLRALPDLAGASIHYAPVIALATR